VSRKALFTWTQCGEVANSIYPLQGIIKLDFLTFLAFEVGAFAKCPKMASFHTFEDLVIFLLKNVF